MSIVSKLRQVLEGKRKVVESVNTKAGSTLPDTCKWDTLSETIDNISTGIETDDATATASDILKDKVAYGKEGRLVGTIETYDGASDVGSSGNTLKTLLDNTKKANKLFYNYSGDNLSDLIQYSDTENVTDFSEMIYYCNVAKTIPLVNTSKGTNFYQFAMGCDKITAIPKYNLSNGTNFSNAFWGNSLVTSFLAYGMKANFNIKSLTKLEAQALITILSNCQVITSTKTLTMGSTLLAKLEGVYVKETGVEQYEGITCRPCVICESTDIGAMLATDYITRKGWTLA